MKDSALIIFVKNPVLGKVKTRLARTIGDEAALAAYHHLLSVTKEVAMGVACQKYIYYSDYLENDDLWEGQGFTKQVQQGKDLGARMADAFKTVLGNHDRVVIIGSDCGDLTSDVIDRAFISLQETDIVIGPSIDGGYYLLGMNQDYPQLFDSIAWSTDQVFKTTLNRALSDHISITELIELSDIDNETDWLRYRSKK